MNIAYLADHRPSIPMLARWSYDQWSYLHPQRSIGDFVKLVSAGINKEHIPVSLVALINDEVIGYASLKATDFQGRPDLCPWLAGLFVDKLHRGQGVGTRLVEEIEKLAAQFGESRLYLITDDAVKFYSRLGWDELETTAETGHSVTIMEKCIASESSGPLG